MTLKNLMAGLSILAFYFDEENGYHLGADNDQIFVYATDKTLPEDAVDKMRELGWFQPRTNEVYSPEESWSAFV